MRSDPEVDRRVAQEFLDGRGANSGRLRQQLPLVRVVGQHLHCGGQLVAGGVGAGVKQDHGEVDKLVVGQPVAVVLCADQLGDQIVGQ